MFKTSFVNTYFPVIYIILLVLLCQCFFYFCFLFALFFISLQTFLPSVSAVFCMTKSCTHKNVIVFAAEKYSHWSALLKGMSTAVAKALHLHRFPLPLRGFISAIVLSQAHFLKPQAPKSRSISSLLIDICWLDWKCTLWVHADPLPATTLGREFS